MKKLLLGTGLFLVSIFGAVAAPLAPLPSSPTYSEPSQIVGTLNALINQLNGLTGYAPAQVVSLGSSCVSAAGGTPVTCNGQRGTGNFTGITVAATGTNQTLVITNSAVTAASICTASIGSAFTAGSGVTVASVTPSAGSLSVVIVNAGTTTNAVTTGAINFSCT